MGFISFEGQNFQGGTPFYDGPEKYIYDRKFYKTHKGSDIWNLAMSFWVLLEKKKAINNFTNTCMDEWNHYRDCYKRLMYVLRF